MERIPDICGDGFDPVEPGRPELEGLGKCGQLCHDMASIRSVRRLIYVYDGRGGSTRPFQSIHSWYQTLRPPKRVGDCFSPLLVAAYLCTRLVTSRRLQTRTKGFTAFAEPTWNQSSPQLSQQVGPGNFAILAGIAKMRCCFWQKFKEFQSLRCSDTKVGHIGHSMHWWCLWLWGHQSFSPHCPKRWCKMLGHRSSWFQCKDCNPWSRFSMSVTISLMHKTTTHATDNFDIWSLVQQISRWKNKCFGANRPRQNKKRHVVGISTLHIFIAAAHAAPRLLPQSPQERCGQRRAGPHQAGRDGDQRDQWERRCQGPGCIWWFSGRGDLKHVWLETRTGLLQKVIGRCR